MSSTRTPSAQPSAQPAKVLVERAGPVLRITLNRPDKANAIDSDMITDLSYALARLSDDHALRVAVVSGVGAHFTGGLDLASLAPRLATGGEGIIPEDGRDPWGMYGEAAGKPVVVAVHGRCFTAGLELVLNSEICIAAEDSVFGQQEVTRGIVPLGGATVRLPQRVGWGNAMRYLLTGDQFDAREGLRLGVVQEVVPAGQQLERALELAHRIARQAPLAVQATMADARAGLMEEIAASALSLRSDVGPRLFATADAAEGITSMVERRAPEFTGT
ncbi:crotonase/enoyl-CoA hydratase family protein [Streptomyces sp.]|uniref:crotonase/enoyl-CoA hydratase family protein n=1 Tax=Streptomyces sp. TaxID=1931 RepID=UPI002D76AFAA|nr:crotonase/enoyl-CoA hydratase family protein [Streptomyces sp.]HET6352834.1 crotonase/enoyl-CoA hydratase family protein [Streptomyces sp.]